MNYDWEAITQQEEENIFDFLHFFGNVIPERKIDTSAEILAKLQKTGTIVLIKNEDLMKNVRK